MAKLPKINRIRREDIPDAPPWIEKLLTPLNTFMEGTYQAFNRNLTFGENLAANVVDLEFDSPAAYSKPVVFARYKSDAANVLTAASVIDFEDKETDTHNAVTTGAAWAFTAPVAGFYTLIATVTGSVTLSTGNTMYIRMRKNTATENLLSLWRAYGAGTFSIYLNGSSSIYCDAGDTLDVFLSASAYNVTLSSNPDYVSVSILGTSLSGQAADDFGQTVRFANPLKTKPVGVFLVSLREKDDINEPIFEPFSVSWRIDTDGQILITYIPGLKAGTTYEGKFIVL